MLYALLFEQGADTTALAESGKGLDELLKQPELKGVLPREVRDHIDTVRKYGNTGTHFQVDGDVSEASTRNTANALTEVVRWYFTRGGGAFPAPLDHAMRALADVQSRIPSPLEAALEQERARTESLHQQLNARDASGDTPTEPPRRGLAPWGAGLCAALFAGALGYALGGSAAPPIVTTAGTIEPTPVPPPAPPTTLALRGAAAAAPAPDTAAIPPAPVDPRPVAAPLRCAPTQRRAAVGGHTFCIDADYVPTRDYRRCVEGGACMRPAPGVGCNWQNGSAFDGHAANCVTRSQALDYCRWRLGGAANLPTRDEWRAVRARGDIVRRDDTGEWTADDAPDGRAWTRGARTAADFAWAQVPPSRADRGVSFRCVVR